MPRGLVNLMANSRSISSVEEFRASLSFDHLELRNTWVTAGRDSSHCWVCAHAGSPRRWRWWRGVGSLLTAVLYWYQSWWNCRCHHVSPNASHQSPTWVAPHQRSGAFRLFWSIRAGDSIIVLQENRHHFPSVTQDTQEGERRNSMSERTTSRIIGMNSVGKICTWPATCVGDNIKILGGSCWFLYTSTRIRMWTSIIINEASIYSITVGMNFF